MPPTISVGCGFTLNLGNFQSARYDMRIDGVDPALPLEPQFNGVGQALLGTAVWLEEQLFKQMHENGHIAAVTARSTK